MTISTYTPCWNILKHNFDYKGALDNFAYYADEISISVGRSEDDTYGALEAYAKEQGYPVSLIRTDFDFENDSYAYGKTENAALQNCKGDLLIQRNLDERLSGDKQRLIDLGDHMLRTPFIDAYYVPTIDLYGSLDKYLSVNGKWTLHKRGFFRGAWKGGIKSDGKPDYDKTSTDELITADGELVKWFPLLRPANGNPTMDDLRPYIKAGMPVSWHVGYLNLNDRLDRSKWWKSFWVSATGGDQNQHPTTIEELANREVKEHGIPQPLWPVYHHDSMVEAEINAVL